jgi:hypothetical protein
MAAVGRAAGWALHELEVRLVDERGRLERVTRPLPAQLCACDTLQLVVYQREDPVQRFGVPILRETQECRHVAAAGRCLRHGSMALTGL